MTDIPSGFWSQGPVDVGLMVGVEPVKIIPKSNYRPYKPQYPIKPEAEVGIEQIIKALREKKVIVPCPDSLCNTPIFPTFLLGGEWSYLQAVNNALVP